MSNLTITNREQIARIAVTESFKDRRDSIVKQENNLAEECYNEIFPEKIRKIIAKIPDNWLRQDQCLYFNAGGWAVNLNARKNFPVPYATSCNKLGNLTGDIATKVQEFSVEKKKIEEEYRNAYVKMLGYLNQFTTFKKLKDAWPEGKKFYEKFDADRISPKVPAVITKEINQMLGLKSK